MMFTNLHPSPPFSKSTAVVPWDNEKGILRPEGAVYHMDISVEEPNWCWVVDEALKNNKINVKEL